MSDKSKDIIITITIAPVANGKRKVLISGAPAQEMPVVRAGTFQDLHHLLDEVWVTLQTRKPQVVKVKAEKHNMSSVKKPSQSYPGDEAKSDQLVAEAAAQIADEPDDAPDPVTAAENAAGADADPVTPEDTEPLPLIEGDTDG